MKEVSEQAEQYGQDHSRHEILKCVGFETGQAWHIQRAAERESAGVA